MDPLSDVLDLTRVHGTVAATIEAGEEWGVEIDHIPGAFHTAVTGAAWLELDDQDPIHLRPGDLVLLPNGPRHRLVATPGAASEPFDLIAAKHAMTTGGTLSLGTGEVHTKILCGSYREDATLNASLLGLLPSFIHLGPNPTRPTEQILRLIAYESSAPRTGTATVLDRLLDILLVHVIRDWLATAETQSLPPSWLTALRDPFIRKALTTLHGDIARDWTLPDLATHLTVSRATLIRRFQALVGQSPLAYLTQWRMQLAAHRLRTTSDSISQIARSVGYTSEHAFNRAFTRVLGTPPGRFRSLDRSNGTGAIPTSNGSGAYQDN